MNNVQMLKKIGVFKASEAASLGFKNIEMSRLLEAGVLIKLDHGVYQHKDYLISPEHMEYIVACIRFGPQVVVGGISALFFYNLIETIPNQVWLLVSTNKKTKDKNYRFLRTKVSLDICVEKHGHFQITSLERSLVEAFYHATKIGLDKAMRATATALKHKDTTLGKIVETAKHLELEGVVNKHWEALSGLQEAV